VICNFPFVPINERQFCSSGLIRSTNFLHSHQSCLSFFLFTHSVVKPKPLLDALAPNEFLANPVKLFEGKLQAPEHLLSRDGVIYTALSNGDVVKIVDDKITVLGKFGKLCRE